MSRDGDMVSLSVFVMDLFTRTETRLFLSVVRSRPCFGVKRLWTRWDTQLSSQECGHDVKGLITKQLVKQLQRGDFIYLFIYGVPKTYFNVTSQIPVNRKNVRLRRFTTCTISKGKKSKIKEYYQILKDTSTEYGSINHKLSR